MVNWLDIWDKLDVPYVPDDWGYPEDHDNPLVMAKTAADYITGAVGSAFSGTEPGAVKRTMDVLGINSQAVDDAAVAVNADGIWKGEKVSFGKSALQPGVTDTAYYVAAQTSRACELHLGIEKKGRVIGILETYQDLIDDGAVTVDDLPFLLKYNPAARTNPGQPYAERLYLQGLGYISTFLWNVMDGFHDLLFTPAELVRGKRMAGLLQRIPMKYRDAVLDESAVTEGASTKASLVKAVKLNQFLVDRKTGRINDFAIESHWAPGSSTLVLEWIANGILSLARQVLDTITWALNIDISAAVRSVGGVTEQDVLNMQMLVQHAYALERNSAIVASDKSISNDGISLDGVVFTLGGTDQNNSMRYFPVFRLTGAAGVYRIIASNHLNAPLASVIRERDHHYAVKIATGAPDDFELEVQSGTNVLVALDSSDPTAHGSWSQFMAGGDSGIVSIRINPK
ncbi:hypothetical protein ABZ769_37305 [Streptomyces olivoreticuli]